MTTSLVVGRSEPCCGLPLSSASRMFIIHAGEEGEPSWGPAFSMGWWPASSSSIQGRRAFTSLAEEANFRYAGPANCGCRRPPRARFPGLDGLGAASDAASCRFGWGVAARPPHGRWSRRAQICHIHGFSRAGSRTGGRYKTSYAAGAAGAFLDGLVLTPAVRTGTRTSSRALGRPPFAGTTLVRGWPLSSVLRWLLPLVRLPTANWLPPLARPSVPPTDGPPTLCL
jgi:hypothetical protein